MGSQGRCLQHRGASAAARETRGRAGAGIPLHSILSRHRRLTKTRPTGADSLRGSLPDPCSPGSATPPHLAAHRDSGAGQHPGQEQHCGTGQDRAWSPARCWRAQLSRGQTASARRRRDCWLSSAPVQRAGVCPCAQLTARGLIPSKRMSRHRTHNCTARENKQPPPCSGVAPGCGPAQGCPSAAPVPATG